MKTLLITSYFVIGIICALIIFYRYIVKVKPTCDDCDEEFTSEILAVASIGVILWPIYLFMYILYETISLFSKFHKKK